MHAIAPISECSRCALHAGAGACAFKPIRRAAGSSIQAQGERDGRARFVKRGLVVLSTVDSSGVEVACALRGPGSLLGWESLAGHPVRAHAHALGDVEVCVAPAAEAQAALRRTPASFELVLEEIARQQAERSFLTGSAPVRLARFLVERHRAGLGSHPLSVERRLLARLLALRPETLSRAEKKLRAAGLTRPGPALFIADRSRLTQLAEGDESILE